MKVVLSRVKQAMVLIEDKEIAKMNSGLMALCAYDHFDTDKDIAWMLEKIHKLRIFEDENEKLNYSAKDLNMPIFLVSQFSLYANYLKGNRPSYKRRLTNSRVSCTSCNTARRWMANPSKRVS